jgi:sugar-specific transcriptional regulator TrmB
MRRNHEAELERLGLSSAEAEIYLALLRNGGPMSASAVATATGHSRSAVYLTLNSLIDMGIVDSEPGYGGRFSAAPPQRAFPSLIARKSDELLQCKQIADELAQELKSAASPVATDSGAEVIQVLRDPRAIAERFERLELEAQRQVDAFVKAPIFISAEGNPAQEEARRRGVRFRSVYERAVIEQPQIEPHIAKWLATGEEMRVYDGELPHKLAIFDSEIVLMPLIRPHQPTKTVVIRHPQLAQSLTLVFEHFWERSAPISTLEKIPKTQDAKSPADQRISRNGRRGQFTKK